ncbi:MAG: TonB-dependent receptor [Betaproteobacteria bacterium]|jgi:outer membrane receptor protein involved in Fe transport|nr:TonB-dependent receptor [Betaproteobacteria bacterium]
MKKNSKAISLIAITSLLLPTGVIAGESVKIDSIEVYSPTALPSIGLPVNDVPYAVQTVTGEEIREQPGVSIADYMVNNLEGVTVNEVGGNPYQLEINYRGYNATPIMGNPQGLSIYVDGVRQNMPFSNNVLWDTIPDFAIDDMQLVGGSNPVYGLNTLGGSLSLQTKSGRTFDKNAIEGSTGSWGRNTGLIESGGVSEDNKYDYYAGYSYFQEDGWRKPSPSEVQQGFAKLGYEDEDTRIDLSYTGAHNSLVGNGMVPKYLLGDDLEGVHTLIDKTRSQYNQVQLAGTEFLSDTLMASGNIYWRNLDQSTYNGDLNDEYCEEDDVGEEEGEGCDTLADVNENEGVINRSTTKSDAYGVNGQLTFDEDLLDRRNQFIFGAAFEYSKVNFEQSSQDIATLDPSGFFSGATAEKEQTSGLTGKTYTTSIFATNNHALNDQWSINTAARYNYVDIRNEDTLNGEGGATSLTGDHDFDRLNPSVGLTYTPTDTLSTYASYNEANRAPTSIELGCANPDNPCTLPTQMADDPPLEQVVAKTFEAGARGRFTSFLNSNTSWNISGYSATNHDDILFIYTEANTTAGYFDNVEETTRKGIDVGLSTAFETWTISMNYNYVKAQYGTDLTLVSENNSSADDGAIQVEDGDYLPNIPKHSFKLRTVYKPDPAWHLGATMTAFSSSYMMGNENQENDSSVNGLQSEVPGYAVVNLDSEYKFSNMFDGWKIYAKVTNLFDNKYYTGGRIAESRVNADRSFSEEEIATASLVGGAPRAGWVGLRYEF